MNSLCSNKQNLIQKLADVANSEDVIIIEFSFVCVWVQYYGKGSAAGQPQQRPALCRYTNLYLPHFSLNKRR